MGAGADRSVSPSRLGPPHAETLVASAPLAPGRDAAREIARRELADPRYEHEPGFLQQALEWVLDQLSRLIASAAGSLPTRVGLFVLVAVVVLLIVVALSRSGLPSRRGAGGSDPLFGERRRSAAQHRSTADEAAARGDWRTSVTERFRAVAAQLEESDVLLRRPGRTAGETAREAGTNQPDLHDDLVTAAHRFDHVLYGDGPAGQADDEHLRALDLQVRGPVRSR